MNRWFFFFLYKAIIQRQGPFFLAMVAVTVAVTSVTAFTTVSWGVRRIMGQTLQSYGANMIVTAGSGQTLSQETIAALHNLVHIQRLVPHVYGSATTSKGYVEIIGMEMRDLPGWRVMGKLPQQVDEIIAGKHLQSRWGIEPGKSVVLGSQAFTVTAIFESGSDEDHAIVMPLAAAQKLTGQVGYSALLVFAASQKLAEVEAGIAEKAPGCEIKTLHRMVLAEEKILGKIQLLISLVTMGVLLATGITLACTTSASVLERAQEIGLMQAMGAASQLVGSFFLAEAEIYALLGAIVGCLAGIAMAQTVTLTAFGSLVPVSPWIVVLAIITGSIVTLAATFVPVWKAMRLMPALTLQGS